VQQNPQRALIGMNPLYFVAIIFFILEQHNNGWHCFVVYSFHADWAVQYVTLCAVSRQGQKSRQLMIVCF
jgi:hypothetical protein